MREIVEKNKKLSEYIGILEKSCADFKKVKSDYMKAYLELREMFNYIDKIIEYNNEILMCNLEYSFRQGLNDNLEHFRNPDDITFLDEDYNDSENEKELRNNTDYIEFSVQKEKLLSLLLREAEDLYNVIVEYQVFLDTYIPKMAHYYGFVTGNTILQNKLIGYKPDHELTNQYKEWLSIYLDLNLE